MSSAIASATAANLPLPARRLPEHMRTALRQAIWRMVVEGPSRCPRLRQGREPVSMKFRAPGC